MDDTTPDPHDNLKEQAEAQQARDALMVAVQALEGWTVVSQETLSRHDQVRMILQALQTVTGLEPRPADPVWIVASALYTVVHAWDPATVHPYTVMTESWLAFAQALQLCEQSSHRGMLMDSIGDDDMYLSDTDVQGALRWFNAEEA